MEASAEGHSRPVENTSIPIQNICETGMSAGALGMGGSDIVPPDMSRAGEVAGLSAAPRQHTLSLHEVLAAAPAEEPAAYRPEIAARAWDKFSDAGDAHMRAVGDVEGLRAQINILNQDLTTASERERHTRHDKFESLREGRVALWSTLPTEQGYVADENVLADAVRLSASPNGTESPYLREQRVAAVAELSSQVKANQPTLVIKEPAAHGHTVQTYFAGTPDHDGFSVMKDWSPSDAFQLGFGERPVVYVAEALDVTEAAGLPEDDAAQIRPAIQVVSGDEVGPFVREKIYRSMDKLDELGQLIPLYGTGDMTADERVSHQQRVQDQRTLRQEVVGIVNAVTGAEFPIPLNGEQREQAVRNLCEYVIDMSRPDTNIRLAAEVTSALEAIYPPEVEVGPAERIIREANIRWSNPRLYKDYDPSHVAWVLSAIYGTNYPTNTALHTT